MMAIHENQRHPGRAYPQGWDKFFRITKNSFSFVRPLYPNHYWDFRWSKYRKFYWNLLLRHPKLSWAYSFKKHIFFTF